MATQQTLPSDDGDISIQGETFSRADIILQVEKIIDSRHFRNSKRYPSFLSFIVEQTLAGATHLLKERTLGTDVFGRPSDYDTNADPIVRVTAGEIRKRIAQYYQESGHEEELRVYLPVGSYVPQFLHAKHAPSFAEHLTTSETEIVAPLPEETTISDPVPPSLLASSSDRKGLPWWGLLVIVASALALGCTGLFIKRYKEQQPIRTFWAPILSSGQQVLIVMGVHSLSPQGGDIATDQPAASSSNTGPQSMLDSMTEWDMVPISDIASYSKVTDLLTRAPRSYRLKGSSDTSLEELRQGPVILIGGLDNIWTIRLTSGLRFYFSRNGHLSSSILDHEQPSKILTFNNMQLVHSDSRDYAIVANYFDPTIRQHVLIAAGIGKSGTQAAAEFVTSNDELKSWMVEKGLTPSKNFELVLATNTINGEPGPPSVIASTSW
ncbi:hypothetical protein [Edaphobacter albus]|uniref:hypothetical protein n=1 Tax=Edaphobacter sp. 4G125 TaxID=2763071 RepID=UPI001645E70B|nr:hypothetical protein [Edaphobacter sp. 4G125]QNI37463.1 hypothetical protein H7846_03910 [Edaphobacter sp. 4G125]